MAGSNYVAYNLAQARSDSEKAQARNNIGAAALASLAASFESRAPSYNWSAGEVCAYGGKLWQFDADHSGAWTGADAHEVNLFDILSVIVTNFVDVSAKVFKELIALTSNGLKFKYSKVLGALVVEGWGTFASNQSSVNTDFGEFKCDPTLVDSGRILGLTMPCVVMDAAYDQHLAYLEMYLSGGSNFQNFMRFTVQPAWTFRRFTAVNGIFYLDVEQKTKFETLFNL